MAFRVTGQLSDPGLEPCPGRDDMPRLMDDTCKPVKCTRQPDWTGYDCCQYWKNPPNMWGNDIVQMDQIDPEKFKYNQFRYQLFAKPTRFPCTEKDLLGPIPDQEYVPPSTDIRALRQTTYIPVVPTKPGGITDVTFPMTPETLGQPDVTTACCVPVIPCNPGFQNMTPCVLPDPRTRCDPSNKCNPPNNTPNRTDICAEQARTQRPPFCQPNVGPRSGPAPNQFMVPPSNKAGSECLGLPATFPQPDQLYAPPFVGKNSNIPNYTGAMPSGGCIDHTDEYCIDDIEDGLNPRGGADAKCTNVKSFRYQDRKTRDIQYNMETTEQRNARLSTMYGAYGAHILKPRIRRVLNGVQDNIKLQGNGFSWGYPKHENRMCYVLERNPRC